MAVGRLPNLGPKKSSAAKALEKIAEFAAEEKKSPIERLRSAMAGRKVKTPARALAEIEKLETAGVTELGDPVFVWPANRGRVTGFAVGCQEHGVMPVLAPSKWKGELAAKRHIVAEHAGAGTCVLTDTAPKLKVGARS